MNLVLKGVLVPEGGIVVLVADLWGREGHNSPPVKILSGSPDTLHQGVFAGSHGSHQEQAPVPRVA